eukprot:scaffold63538_cov31-Tisochrysis_lutea.AAC.1
MGTGTRARARTKVRRTKETTTDSRHDGMTRHGATRHHTHVNTLKTYISSALRPVTTWIWGLALTGWCGQFTHPLSGWMLDSGSDPM